MSVFWSISFKMAAAHVTEHMLTQKSIKSRLSLIVRVNVVLNRTVVVDSD